MKPTKVNRAALLQCLEAVEAGLSVKDVLVQSSSFVFRKGRVMTFKEEIFIKAKTPLPPDLTAAVHGRPLIEALRKLPDDDVTVAAEGNNLCVRGKHFEYEVVMDPDIQLPVDEVERPPADAWRDLPPEFSEALRTVAESAGKDDQRFILSCVHVHPKWVEAFDLFVFSRFRVRTQVDRPAIIRAECAKAIAKRGPTKVAVTGGWLHFRGAGGLLISTQSHEGPYPDIGKVANLRGEPTAFPKAMKDAADLGEVFSSERTEDNELTVEIRGDRVTLTGVGVTGTGRARGRLRTPYLGAPVSFNIGPESLRQLVDKHAEVQVGRFTENGVEHTMLIGISGKFFYAATTEELKNGKRKPKEKPDAEN